LVGSGLVLYISSLLVGSGLVLALSNEVNAHEAKDEKKASSTSTSTSTSVDYGAVRKAIAELLDAESYDDGSYGPVLVRLAWHSAGTYDKASNTGGSSGATMRFKPESEHGANAGLALAREKLEAVKKKFPGISYGDLYTLAGVVAVEEMGGPTIPWRAGRVDSSDGKSCPPDGRLPDASKVQDHVRAIFYRMGFDDREIVALLGAHSLGRCHKDRSGYSGPWTRAPTTFSNEFYRVLLEEQWTEKKWDGPRQFENKARDLMMTPADMCFIEDKEFRKHVEAYAKDSKLFFTDFAKAYSKLLELGVKFPSSASSTSTSTTSTTPSTTSTKPTETKKEVKKEEKKEEKSWWQKIFG